MVCNAWADYTTVACKDFVLHSLTAKRNWVPAKCQIPRVNFNQPNVARS